MEVPTDSLGRSGIAHSLRLSLPLLFCTRLTGSFRRLSLGWHSKVAILGETRNKTCLIFLLEEVFVEMDASYL